MDNIQKQIAKLVKDANPDNPIAYVDTAVKGLMVDTVNELILDCNDCKNCVGAGKTIVSGNPHGSILVLNSIASECHEDIRETEKEYLADIFEVLGINTSQLVWMNSVCCVPFLERNKEKIKKIPSITEEIKNCRLFTNTIIDSLKPLYILVIGRTAMAVLEQPLSIQSGEWFLIRDTIKTMFVNSPTMILDFPDKDLANEYAKDLEDNIASFFEAYEKEFPGYIYRN